MTTTPTALHPFFETLGPGPYHFVGCYDLGEAMDPTSAANFGNMTGWLSEAPRLKAGMGTCAHCGTAIMNVCIVRVGNGDLYGVGEDCVEKCSQGGLWKGAKAVLAARRNAMARARNAAKRAAQWEAERPEREKAIAAANAAQALINTGRKAERLARFDLGILTALVDHFTLDQWRTHYAAEAHHTYGQHDARFSPPCDASNFFHSLAIQLIEHGTLSPRQAEYAAKAALGRRTNKNAEAFDALANSLTA